MNDHAHDEIEYCGPEGQTSEVFGPLIPGRRYQAEAALAAYLCSAHPEYWRPVTARDEE